MNLFENKVGRPSNDIIKKRKIFYVFIGAFVIGILGFSILLVKVSSSKLKGATNSKSLYIENVSTTSAIVHWKASGSLKANSFTIYNSTSACKAGKKVESHIITNNKVSTYKINGTWKISNLKQGTYYLASVKYNDNKILNKCFKTDKKISYNINNLSKNIGTQCYKCAHYYDLAYGHYILTGGKTRLNSSIPKVSSYGENYYGAYQSRAQSISSLWNNVKKQIDSGIPILLKAVDPKGITPYHCILVVGYKNVNPTSTSDFFNSIYFIDSIGTGLNKIGANNLKEYVGKNDPNIESRLYDLTFSTWSSINNARNSNATKK